LIFSAALAYNYHISQQVVLSQVTENARNLAHRTACRIEKILLSAEKVPQNLAATLEVHPLGEKDLLQLMKKTVQVNPEIFGTAVAYEPYAFNPQRYYFCPYVCQDAGRIKTSYLGSDTYRYFYWDWYQLPKELNRPLWSDPYFDEGGGNIIMSTYSVPFYHHFNGQKKFQGIVTLDISLKWLQEMVGAVKIYQSGYAFLISHVGVFVTHPDEQLIMRESIFSVAEAKDDLGLRQLGREMIRGGEGFVPLQDFSTGKKSWLYYSPLTSTGWSLGVIFPEDELFGRIRQLSLELILLGSGGLLLLALVIIVLSRSITKPLRTLAQTTEAIGQGDFNVTVPERGSREIVHLARSFNRLGDQLTEYIEKRDFIRDTFGRYLTQEIVHKLLESKDGLKLGGENREVSILLSDLRGFTAITAEMPPEDVIKFLNRYLSKMIEILIDHRAIIDEIIGDGILAFFGAPEPQEDHPVQAVACALAMQVAMEEINHLNEADGLPHLEMGIAVNTGNVIVGNIGSEQRTKYGLVGAQVNFTGRMESFSIGGQVLISPSTYAKVQDLIEVRHTFPVEMKGVPAPVTLYEVGGITGPYNLRLPERVDILVTLTEPLPVHLQRLKDKVVIGSSQDTWIIQLSLGSAVLKFKGELAAWEDIRMQLAATHLEQKGNIYGKVIDIQPGDNDYLTATIRFTSVSPEIYQVIRQLTAIL
jgi:sigma-B regulation protein RsbU (phosphoserine phosphatase)